MNQDLINRYQPGGDIYAAIAGQLGTNAANSVAQAALSGDETAVNAAYSQAKFGNPLNTSTSSILLNQLATDPLGAPLAGVENALKNSWLDIFKSPWFIVTVAGIAFFAFGGTEVIKAQIAKLTK